MVKSDDLRPAPQRYAAPRTATRRAQVSHPACDAPRRVGTERDGERLVWIGEWQHPAPYDDLLKELLRLHGLMQLAFVKGHDAGTRPDVCHTCRVLKGEAR